MRVNTVSIHPAQKGLPSHNKEKVSFKHVNYMKLTRPEIQRLYEDGPGIIRMLDNVIPVLNKKFSEFFDLSFSVYSNYYRLISMKITGHTADRMPALKNYIVENNKLFNFPEFVINDFKAGKNNYEDFLYGRYVPLVEFEFAKLGEQKSTEKILKFAKENDIDSIIQKFYKAYPPVEIKKTSSTASSYVYGNPGV